MKVKLKDLVANPYRDIKHYPIDQDKVKILKDSIEKTGFWDNILARSINGENQIAYGHHRLHVLNLLYEPTHEVDIPVKVISDANMVKIMADENVSNWGCSVAVTDETIKVAKQFLEDNPEELKRLNSNDTRVGKSTISKFLGRGWSEYKISSSLNRQDLYGEKIDKKAVELMPSTNAANTFVKAALDTKIDFEDQLEAAELINRSKKMDYASMHSKMLDVIFKEDVKSKKEIQVETLEKRLDEIRKKADSLYAQLDQLDQLRKEFEDSETLIKSDTAKLIINSLTLVNNKINNLLNVKQNEQLRIK